MVLPLLFGGLMAANAVGQNILGRRNQKRQDKLTMEGYKNNLTSVAASQKQNAEDTELSRRRMQENLAERGVEDSTIASDQSRHFQNRADRMAQALQRQRSMATNQMNAYRKARKDRKLGDILGLLGLGGSLGLGMSGLFQSSAPPAPSYNVPDTGNFSGSTPYNDFSDLYRVKS